MVDLTTFINGVKRLAHIGWSASEFSEAANFVIIQGNYHPDYNLADQLLKEHNMESTASATNTATPVDNALDIKRYIADEAKRITNGARRSAYGSPEKNFERIAKLWNAFLVNRGIITQVEDGLTPTDVSLLMVLMKVARLSETPDHLDSFVDMVGYTLTAAEAQGVEVPSNE